MQSSFLHEQLSPNTWKVVENDPFKQYPFLYVVLGEDKCILIDTGCGTADYLSFLNTHINTKGLKYLVICTHVHFDHVGGNFQFSEANCIGIYLGGKNQTFTQNFEINSLAMAHNGAKVKPFVITRWLKEGDLIFLDDQNQKKEKSLEVLFTPGHTPDSIALYAHWEKRLFVGDTLYPFTAIHLDCLGSSVTDFKSSLKRMINFISNEQKGSELSISNAPSSLTSEHQQALEDVLGILGLSKDAINFNLETLLEFWDWSVEETINCYLTNNNTIHLLCPVQSSQNTQNSSPPSNQIQLSCGHVESNLNSNSLQQLLDMLEFIQNGALAPVFVDGEYGEYSNEYFTLMVPLKLK